MNDAPILAYIALGANLGEPQAMVQNAIIALDALPRTRLIRASSLYRTAPVGLKMQPDFINAVAAIATTLAPQDLLLALQNQEAAQGRVRSIPNAPRTLDLDLLLYGDCVMNTPTLTLPHPRMHLRAFVLSPLAEIAPADLPIPNRGSLAAWRPAVANQRVLRLTT
ncbi:MAG: 2-amino-4-hydroxy-6-hydroxymethyldihydropteridine diphosphokinase [Zoogloeaceae bacterium]|jgi:2-amino-4-hydroxy-6-hydroxymethyldihydropteridine diphosphokinase|nr:2-amino-4-hydroxy-6-hydroxymethyldihydropteridine diphosphokinase [Zoogloeaceae bacterium]